MKEKIVEDIIKWGTLIPIRPNSIDDNDEYKFKVVTRNKENPLHFFCFYSNDEMEVDNYMMTVNNTLSNVRFFGCLVGEWTIIKCVKEENDAG